MTLYGKGEIISAHADTVIIDNDTAKTAAQKTDIDLFRRGIDSVFDQFLDCTCRPFDNLPCGDLIDHCIGKQADGRLFHGLFDCQWCVVLRINSRCWRRRDVITC